MLIYMMFQYYFVFRNVKFKKKMSKNIFHRFDIIFKIAAYTVRQLYFTIPNMPFLSEFFLSLSGKKNIWKLKHYSVIYATSA